MRDNNKKRYEFNEDKSKIRARQGHSVEVDLELKEATPPDVLYHGTADSNRDSIFLYGLEKGKRLHVHLSADVDTARIVGARHGNPIVYEVDCKRMVQNGAKFYLSANGVWLTDYVSPKYLREIDKYATFMREIEARGILTQRQLDLRRTILDGIEWDTSDVGWCDCILGSNDESDVGLDWFNSMSYDEDDPYDNVGNEFTINLSIHYTYPPSYTPFYFNHQIGLERYLKNEIYFSFKNDNGELDLEITATPMLIGDKCCVEIIYHDNLNNDTIRKVIDDKYNVFSPE